MLLEYTALFFNYLTLNIKYTTMSFGCYCNSSLNGNLTLTCHETASFVTASLPSTTLQYRVSLDFCFIFKLTGREISLGLFSGREEMVFVLAPSFFNSWQFGGITKPIPDDIL